MQARSSICQQVSPRMAKLIFKASQIIQPSTYAYNLLEVSQFPIVPFIRTWPRAQCLRKRLSFCDNLANGLP
jgi:hypothetical protein